MSFLNKHQIAQYDDLKHKVLDVWGGQLKIRVMTMKEVQLFNEFMTTEPNDKAFNFYLLKMCCIDEDGNHIFDDGDDAILDNLSLQSVNFVVKEILTLSNQNTKSTEDLAKN